MEFFITFVSENWSTIIEYALMFVAYFLVFLYRKSLLGTKLNIDTAFAQWKESFKSNEETSASRLLESQNNYQRAIDNTEDLRKRIAALEAAVKILLGDDVAGGA